MHESVEDGIGECGIADDVVPLFDRQLRGDDGGACRVSVIEDVEQVAALFGIERCQALVIKDDEIGLRKLGEEPGIGAEHEGEVLNVLATKRRDRRAAQVSETRDEALWPTGFDRHCCDEDDRQRGSPRNQADLKRSYSHKRPFLRHAAQGARNPAGRPFPLLKTHA